MQITKSDIILVLSLLFVIALFAIPFTYSETISLAAPDYDDAGIPTKAFNFTYNFSCTDGILKVKAKAGANLLDEVSVRVIQEEPVYAGQIGNMITNFTGEAYFQLPSDGQYRLDIKREGYKKPNDIVFNYSACVYVAPPVEKLPEMPKVENKTEEKPNITVVENKTVELPSFVANESPVAKENVTPNVSELNITIPSTKIIEQKPASISAKLILLVIAGAAGIVFIAAIAYYFLVYKKSHTGLEGGKAQSYYGKKRKAKKEYSGPMEPSSPPIELSE